MKSAESASRRRRPQSLFEAVQWGSDERELGPYLREFLDEFYGVETVDERVRMLAEDPLPVGVDTTDAYVAAVAEHLSLQYGLPVPRWSWRPSRFLRRPYFPAGLESLKSTYLVSSPSAFRRRMIFVEADPLSRPRRAA